MPPPAREPASPAGSGAAPPNGPPRPVVLVTGASSGLGAALAREFLPPLLSARVDGARELEHVRDDERLAQMDANFLGPNVRGWGN
ncbi:MAG: hypothetical protein ACSLFQ_13905 [Thermoanaerobaculia bacterium]